MALSFNIVCNFTLMRFTVFKIILLLCLCSVLRFAVAAEDKVITLAVGHDHDKMVSANYPIYRANWEFITQSLDAMGYKVNAVIVPWARAKQYTQDAIADGLFLAANLPGRDNWAVLSEPLGFGVFGAFYNVSRPDDKAFIASVRVGEHDRVLSQYNPTELFEVATAQLGFKLLYHQRVDRLIMSESYGKFLLDTELKGYSDAIGFDESMIEQRTVHIAFSKSHAESLAALDIINQAIAEGIRSGFYASAMERNSVPTRMRLAIN